MKEDAVTEDVPGGGRPVAPGTSSLQSSLPPLSRASLSVTPFMVMEIMERAGVLEKEGRSVIRMEVGEPDFPTPPAIADAMRESLKPENFRYAHSLGDPVLRNALSRHYLKTYGVAVEPERFLITPGSSVGMTLLFGALLEPGDKVVLTDPCYSCYPNFLRFFGGVAARVKVSAADGFEIDPVLLKKTIEEQGPVKAVMINSPANPAGAVLGPGKLEKIASLGTFVISDEIYHGLSYSDERDHTILEHTRNAVVVGGFSKAFAMTGWRVGYLVVPPEWVRTFQSLSQNFVISVNASVQKAAAAALEKALPEARKMRSVYDRRRTLLLRGLSELGLGVPVEPAGAFYVLADASRIDPDSRALAFDLLEKAGVATAPGLDFGPGAEGFLRFSYAVSEENIVEALKRIKIYLENRGLRPGARGNSLSAAAAPVRP
ncbi:MAG: aminotransferase class I/II-fold pyridoxal phosphate-dependent enzyme [Deltaproteobacteria bacterium]|jgi:aspartate/methionine/tyrosine aminotransferase|nr:aminotransferase class I/II-fold pyridoxal phosphate-dependent enzyme [Deltaproteobacteria bacterium]